MKSVSGQAFCRILEKNGWSLLRIHGSHHIYGKEDKDLRLSVPVHGNRPLKTGLLRHLLRLSGLSEGDV
jgi:predicted RNA binding protein YcfA (HicA-like mRNA interferase family)